jgi:hypothetical protein
VRGETEHFCNTTKQVMKTSLLLILLLYSVFTFSQKTIYNTNIKSAEKVTIKNEKGSTVIIYTADKVEIAKVIAEKAKTRILLKELTQRKDTSGLWITVISFANPDTEGESEKINISVQCNSQINSANWGYTEGISYSFGITEEKDLQKGSIKYKASKLSAGSVLILTITSSTQIKPIISGIDG